MQPVKGAGKLWLLVAAFMLGDMGLSGWKFQSSWWADTCQGATEEESLFKYIDGKVKGEEME